MFDTDVLVIGGGISGLSVARLLAREGVGVEVWEAAQRAGGKIRSVAANGYLMEQSTSMVLNFRPEVNRFLALTGLEEDKMPRAPVANRYLASRDGLLPVPDTPLALLASPLWSLSGRLRLLLEPFIPRNQGRDETVSEFITRRLGREPLEKIMESYVAGPLASDPDFADAHAVLPRMTELERRYGSLTMGVLIHKILRRRTATPTEAFSFSGGMSTLVDSLAAAPRMSLRLGHRATGLEPVSGGWRIHATAAEREVSLTARQVVLGVPASVAASLLRPLDVELGRLLDGIETTPLSVVHTGFQRTAMHRLLDGSGFLVPRHTGFTATGCQWMSSLFPDRAPAGRVLLSTYMGGARRPEVVDWDDQRSLAAAMESLQPLLGVHGEPEMLRVDRHPQGLPLYHGTYFRRMADVDKLVAGLAGLHLEANYKGGVSVRDRIVCGYTAARRILKALGRHSQMRKDSKDTGDLRANRHTPVSSL
jgi:oxygen-dependent protoporphyrinogen oxidase